MSPSNYKEQDFEEHIEQHLVNSGYRSVHHSKYDRGLCLIPEELISFIKATQPRKYENLQRQYGEDTDRKITERFARVIARDGVLEVLRKGVRDRGVHLRALFFKPVSGRNPEHSELYEQNRLAVVRQLHYSNKNENSIDLGLFVNGLPIITAELKNSLTGQTVEQAKKQYRQDRDPKEPLLRFKRCLVHFAVGNEKVYMATRLAGRNTCFLPFNKDVENPVNPNGHKTAYLWEHFWQKDVLLNLLQNYLHVEVEKEKIYSAPKEDFETIETEKLIFPRYQQYDAVQKLLRSAKQDAPGNSYLVQHSAGSGKSNSIAWLSHGLRQLFDDESNRLFDSIIVITDRKVLDKQLQDTITQFEQVKGTVVPITKASVQLQESLEEGKDIIVSTLQKFPVISETISELKGQNFAVVIDEAHSSQTGESAKHLKKALSANLEDAEDTDETGEDMEDEVIRNIRERGKQDHISYFAFTATPKNKTLELFGTRMSDGSFPPFHTYDMHQAIAEGFIVDVLRNYTTFKRYFKLVKSVEDDQEYEAQKAVRALTSYVDLQPHAIETKTNLMLNHFMGITINAIQGKGRAMLVTRSRLHTVKYYLKFKKIMQERGLNVKPLVAFSGTVRDPDTGIDHTENSLNGLGPRISIKDAFKLPEYRILIVANKFQTGFDCPPLHTMWVDKKLSGVQAVQTLSRLNRKMTGKARDDTAVLDFVNEAEDIQAAFQPFYGQTSLVEETDPNKLYDIESELSNLDIYTPDDIEDYCDIFYSEGTDDEFLQPVLDRVVDQWRTHNEEERESFRSYLQSYIRLYSYLGQLIDFTDPELEKLYVFARSLNRKLPKRKTAGLPQEIFDEVDLDSFRIQKRYEGHIQLREEDGELAGISSEVGAAQDAEFDYLSNIIETINENFGLELDERDKIRLQQIVEDVETDESVQAVMNGNNTMTNKRTHVNSVVEQKVLDQVNDSIDLYQKLSEAHVSETLKRRLFDRLLRQTG